MKVLNAILKDKQSRIAPENLPYTQINTYRFLVNPVNKEDSPITIELSFDEFRRILEIPQNINETDADWLLSLINIITNSKCNLSPGYDFRYNGDEVSCTAQSSNISRINLAYKGFFEQTIKEIAFVPQDAYEEREREEAKYENLGQIKEFFIYTGYLAATVVTLLCAGLIGLASILTYPVPFIVAAVLDGFDWASDLVDEWSSKETQIKRS